MVTRSTASSLGQLSLLPLAGREMSDSLNDEYGNLEAVGFIISSTAD